MFFIIFPQQAPLVGVLESYQPARRFVPKLMHLFAVRTFEASYEDMPHSNHECAYLLLLFLSHYSGFTAQRIIDSLIVLFVKQYIFLMSIPAKNIDLQKIGRSMRSPGKEGIRPFGRRDFLKVSVAAGLSLIAPVSTSCEVKKAAGVGEAMSNIELGTLAEEKVVIPGAFSGKVLILHFWASWCSTCRGEMIALENVFREYSNQGAMPCSIGIGEKRETALRYIKNLDITYPVLLDPDLLTQRLLGISGVPTYYLLDRKGIIRRKILGETGNNEWGSIIRTVL